jgi:hypothetical protein
MVAVDDDERAVADAGSPHGAGVLVPDQRVGAGDHEVVWHVS